MIEGFPLPGLPPDGVIDVWRIDLDRPPAGEVDLNAILSAEERGRADRFVFPIHSNRFRLGRAMLRLGLGWYLGRSPREIALTMGWRGKPGLVEPSALHFNVTHCGGVGLIAFTTVGEAGIDVEGFDRKVESLDIADANFTRNEARLIAAAGSPDEQTKTFLRFWTRKEAVLKAAGGGLLDGLDSVDVSGEPPGVVEVRAADAQPRWLVRDLAGMDGFASAIAAPPGDWKIREWEIDCAAAMARLVGRFPELWQ